jgi:hypothetical protein
MKLAKKTLSKAGKAFMALTQENSIKNNNGGLSSILVPRQANLAGVGVIAGGTILLGTGKAGFKSGNKAQLGDVSYTKGPARMTNSFISGGVKAMHDVSRGDPAVFSDLADDVLQPKSLGAKIDDYGANPELISALYNMGGK